MAEFGQQFLRGSCGWHAPLEGVDARVAGLPRCVLDVALRLVLDENGQENGLGR